MTDVYDRLRTAVEAVAARTGRDRHDAAVVLGSGLSTYAASLTDAIAVPYADIPHFPVPRVEGHAGTLYSVRFGERAVLVLAGRVHAYEGWDLADVVFGVRVAALAGCRTVLLTNAAGGVAADLAPGDLVMISDHLNLAARNPLVGPNDDRLGPRFPDLTDAYDPEVRALGRSAFEAVGVPYREGVYAWMLGPSFETPAEIRMVARLGGDLVGMSTVPEAIALRHLGVAVGGISLVTNLAAGISPTPLSHEEVTETADRARDRIVAVLDRLLPLLAAR
ncbi:MAG TPA: purine-nucleoside phosphorylase [Actinobacteria bacterium]|nr:purine-nucleoside phosphorylase [Actinomycetota bacterium]